MNFVNVGLHESGRPIEEDQHALQQQILLLLVFSFVFFQRDLASILRLNVESWSVQLNATIADQGGQHRR